MVEYIDSVTFIITSLVDSTNSRCSEGRCITYSDCMSLWRIPGCWGVITCAFAPRVVCISEGLVCRPWKAVYVVYRQRKCLGDCSLALTLTIRHIYSFPRLTDQAFTDAHYAQSKSKCYHTSTFRNTPKAHTVWVSDTTALRTTTVGAINKQSDSESYWIDILYRTLLASVSPSSEFLGLY